MNLQTVKNRFGINEEKILHMFNPIDITQFKPRERKEIIGKIKFEIDKKYLLHVGRLIEDHGIEIILDVFKIINQKNKNIILIIIGDGPLLKKIQQFILENNLEDFVELKGRLDHKLISYYYNIGSALFHVGPSGGMPNVIMEAIVSGLPVIASNSTAANKDLVNEKNGKLYKSFRGMGSVGAMNKGSADRYFQTKQKDTSKYVPEGVEGFAKYKGDVGSIIYKLIGGLRSSMGYLGSKNITKLRIKPNFVKITKAGFYESMVHNVDVVKNDSKY